MISISKTSPAAVGVLLTLFGLLGGGVGCGHLAYQPSDVMFVSNPEKLDALRQEISFVSSDGVKLAGWYFKAVEGGHRGTVIQFHGNAQNMTSHFASMLWLTHEGYDLFTFDYRGYGISEGKPTQEGLNRDALAAIRYVMSRNKRGAKPDLVLYGQSLGGAVLMRAYDDCVTEERARVAALVVEGSFDNYHRIGAEFLSRHWLTYLFQPLAYLLVSNAYGPEDSIPRVSPTPLLVIHADTDPVIPFRFGERIFAEAKEPKRFIKVTGGGHIDAMAIENGAYRARLLAFIRR